MASKGGKIRNETLVADLGRDLDLSQDSLCFDGPNIPSAIYRQIFVVLRLSRYYPDPRSRSYYGLNDCVHWDAFDIVLTDGKSKRKFVGPADIVVKQKICPGRHIKVKRIERYWEETENGRFAIAVIHDVEVLPKECLKDTDALMSLPWVPSNFSKQEMAQPLVSNRVYYMDNWTFNLAADQDFGENIVKHSSLGSIDLSEVSTIKSVVRRKAAPVKCPYLLVKVMRKSRLIQYITSFKEDAWPFQLPLMVADRTGWCPAVLWNRLAVQLYQNIQEGTMLLLKNFRVKQGMQQQTKSYFRPLEDAVVFPNELSLDIHHPKAEIFLVDCAEDDDIDELGLPGLEVRLMSRRDLISVPDFSVVDVGGMVTYVSHVEREPKKVSTLGPRDSGGFFYRRWLHLRDNSLNEAIIVLVYSGDQMSTFFELQPGQHVLCRCMLSNQQMDDLTTSRQKRHQWLTTTTNSWVYIIDQNNPSVLPLELRRLVKTFVSSRPQKYTPLFMEGGIFRYPPHSTDISSLYGFPTKRLDQRNLTTWRECHRLLLRACLKSICYIKLKPQGIQESRSSTRNKAKTDFDPPFSDASFEVEDESIQDILNLWPNLQKGKKKNFKAALRLSWYETDPVNHFSTWKPCAFLEKDCEGQFNNLEDLMAGQYDCGLDLVDCERTYLQQEELDHLLLSAKPAFGHEFVLLVDGYTNRENQQVLVLNRAFEIR